MRAGHGRVCCRAAVTLRQHTLAAALPRGAAIRVERAPIKCPLSATPFKGNPGLTRRFNPPRWPDGPRFLTSLWFRSKRWPGVAERTHLPLSARSDRPRHPALSRELRDPSFNDCPPVVARATGPTAVVRRHTWTRLWALPIRRSRGRRCETPRTFVPCRPA